MWLRCDGRRDLLKSAIKIDVILADEIGIQPAYSLIRVLQIGEQKEDVPEPC